MITSWFVWGIAVGLVACVVASTPRDRTGVRPALTAVNLVALLFVLYFIFPAAGLMIGNAQFTWAVGYGGWTQLQLTIILGSLGFGAFGVPLVIHRLLNRSRTPENAVDKIMLITRSKSLISLEPPRLILYILLAVGIGLKLYMVATTGGLDSMLLRLSGNARETGQVSGLDAGDIGIRTLSGLADAAATWGLISALRSHRGTVPWIVIWGGTMALSYATVGKRLALLLPVVAILLAVHNFVRPLSTRLFPLIVLGALVFGMATLLFRVYAPAETAGITIDLNQVPYARGSLLLFYLNSLEFSTVEMMTVVIQSGSDIINQFGTPDNALLQLYVFPFLYTVPRAIWLNKPDQVFDLSYSVSSAILGRRAEDSNVGYVTTLVGNSYLFGGIGMLLLTFCAFGLCAAGIDRWARTNEASTRQVFTSAIMLVLAFHFFRMGTLAWTFLIGVVQQYGVLLGLAVILLSARVFAPRRGEGKDAPKQALSRNTRLTLRTRSAQP